MNKNIKRGYETAIWGLFLLFNLSAICFALYAFMKAVGIEITRIYLNSSYKYQFITILIMPGVLFIACAYMAIYAAIKIIGRAPGPKMNIRAASLLSAAMLCLTAGGSLYEHNRRVYGDRPSASERFWARVGPFVQFGPFQERRASYGSVVIWYFDPSIKKTARIINYGPEPDPNRMQKTTDNEGLDRKRHEFHLTGLKARTQYYYQIPDWGEKIYSFRTPPAEDSPGPFRFICLGDTGDTIRGGYHFSYYRDIMRAAKKFYADRGSAPSFMIHSGDMVRTGSDLDAWHQHFTSNDSPSFPTMMAPGNHGFLEDRGGNYRYFFHLPDYYTFDYANAHFLVIHPFDGPGTSLDGPAVATGADQYRFIRKDLEGAHGKKWTIVVMHIPILSTGDYHSNEILMAQYMELFRKHRVDLVVSGHNHDFGCFHVDEDSPWGGTLYIIAGTGGSKLDSYIMTRKNRRWKAWFHDPKSVHGLYQKDLYTKRYYEYGELSWGFADVEISNDTMTVSFYRWLDFERFLKITGQNRNAWEMVPFDAQIMKNNNLWAVKLVKKFMKIKK